MTNAKKVAEIGKNFVQDEPAQFVSYYWDLWNRNRQQKVDEWIELKKYLFATDTRTTSNSKLPWKNSTTTPKLTQIRDNLHANYYAALFPNDKWIKWEGYSNKDSSKKKARVITAYMSNKLRESGSKREINRALLDYIDYGNCFIMPTFEDRHNENNEELIPAYVGPRSVRIDPFDIVFNPLASRFEDTAKIIRSIKTIGEIKKLASENPGESFWEDVIDRRENIRKVLSGWNADDFAKSELYSVDGFGSLLEYYQSEFVEVLEFYGDYHNNIDGDLTKQRMITVVDRALTARDVPIPTYSGEAPIRHVGWRERPGNLWGMGPLDNLVGMQYRLDHLENLKADAMDLVVHPPLKIIGDVEPFTWGPDELIHIDGEGDVQEVSKNLQAIFGVEQEMQLIETRMEIYSGSPREAAGIRSPGEKTAFEVQALENASGRIFQNKIVKFEEEFLEPHMNDFFETGHRNFSGINMIRTKDDDLGIEGFEQITKSDITAKGVIRPIGARNFAQKAQELQNLVGILGGQVGQIVLPHTSAINLTKYIEDVLDIRSYKIFTPDARTDEVAQTNSLASQAERDSGIEGQIAQQFAVEGGV